MFVAIPTEKELALFVEAGARRGRTFLPASLGRIAGYKEERLGWRVACCGLGKAEFGVRTQHWLDQHEAELLVCAGAAGALAAELEIGDVVVGVETVEHDFRNRFSDRPIPRFPGSPGRLAALRELTPPSGFTLRFGPIASGDEDIVDPARASELRDATGALAVAWEGAGGARSAAFSQIDFLEVRGITDFADPVAPESYDHHLGRAMGNVLAVLESLTSYCGTGDAALRA